MLASHEPTTNRRSSATSAATSTLLNFCFGMVRVGVARNTSRARARSPGRTRSTTPAARRRVRHEFSAAAVS